MIKIFVFTFTIIALLGALFVISGDMGYLQVRLAGWKVETTLGISLLIFTLIVGATGVLFKIIMLPVQLSKQWSNDRIRLQSTNFSEGLVLFANEELESALNKFTQIKPGVFYLPALFMSILIAQKSHDYRKRDELVQRALHKHPENRSQIHLIESICLQQSGEIEPALQLLQSHIESKEHNVSHWRRLAKIFVDGGRWSALENVLERSKIKLPTDELDDLRARVIAQQLSDCKNLQDFLSAWDGISRKMRLHPIVLESFCEEGGRLGWKGDFVAPILAGLKKNWNIALLHCLERVPIQSIPEVLKWLDKEKKGFNSPELYITYSILAAREKMWGIAEESIKKAETFDGKDSDILLAAMLLAVLQENPIRAKALLFDHLKNKYPQLIKL